LKLRFTALPEELETIVLADVFEAGFYQSAYLFSRLSDLADVSVNGFAAESPHILDLYLQASSYDWIASDFNYLCGSSCNRADGRWNTDHVI
jgi:hypothetical protein